MFKKKNMSKYEHVSFVQDFRSGISTYEILVRFDLDSGLPEYKRVFVGKCVHNLVIVMENWFKNK